MANETKQTPGYSSALLDRYTDLTAIHAARPLTESEAEDYRTIERHIVACVNFCEGVETRLLEPPYDQLRTRQATLMRVMDREDKAVEQRNELLAALQGMPTDDVDMVEHNPDEGESFFCCGAETSVNHGRLKHKPDCWYAKARAVIRKFT